MESNMTYSVGVGLVGWKFMSKSVQLSSVSPPVHWAAQSMNMSDH